MTPWIFSDDRVAKISLILLVACVYSGSILINNQLLFFWAEDEPYRYWLYPPAGLRLLLIMLLGFPAVIGIGLASASIYVSPIVPEVTAHSMAFILGFSESLAVYVALTVYGNVTGSRHPWIGLSWRQVPIIAVICSISASVTSNIARMVLGIGDVTKIERDITLNVVGDTSGSILFLAVLVLARKSYLAYQKNQ